MSLQHHSDDELLQLSRPNVVQRFLRAAGCPGMLFLGYYLSRWTASSLAEGHAILAWLVALTTFFVATPILLAMVALISSFNLRHAKAELRRRLGQDDFKAALEQLETEVSELPDGNRGWVVLIRGQLVTAGERAHVRLDLRTDEAAPTARIESARGPRLNLFGNSIEDMSRWQRSSRELLSEESRELNQIISNLGPDSVRDKSAGSRLWLNIALLRVDAECTTSRCRVRVNRPDQQDLPLLALVAEAWRLSGWDPGSP